MQRAQAEAAASASPAEDAVPSTSEPVRPTPTQFVAQSAPNKKTPTSRFPFGVVLAASVAVLAVVVGALSAISLVQGPRLSDVQVDPAGAIEASGSRVIMTANQALAPIDEAQVSVEPAVPFTIDSSGRGIGVRFTVPLDDDTEYTVRVADAAGIGGGATGTLETSFRTPVARIFLLQRDAQGDDTIFSSDLSGEEAVPVFQHEQITDFRATAAQLVVSVEIEGTSTLLVMNRDGTDQRELTLPGVGYVSTLQVSDRGGLVGYTFTDQNISATSGRASVLVTQLLRGEGEPQIVEVAGKVASVASWQFVPDTAAALFIDFTGALFLDDRAGDAGPQALGLANSIQGISRGTYTAVVERSESLVTLNLADGSEEPVTPSTPDYGTPTTIIPFPGGELRHIALRDAAGMPTGQLIVRVDEAGVAEVLYEVGENEAILQTCASPSGRYTAVAVARELTNNKYDRSLLPMPETVRTHILDTETGEERVILSGFDISWCAKGPGR